MRRQGVHKLIAYCLNDACRHQSIIDVSSYPGDTPVPWFVRQVRRSRHQDRRAAELEGGAGLDLRIGPGGRLCQVVERGASGGGSTSLAKSFSTSGPTTLVARLFLQKRGFLTKRRRIELICGLAIAVSLLGGCENSARFALTPQSDGTSDCRQMQQKLTDPSLTPVQAAEITKKMEQAGCGSKLRGP